MENEKTRFIRYIVAVSVWMICILGASRNWLHPAIWVLISIYASFHMAIIYREVTNKEK